MELHVHLVPTLVTSEQLAGRHVVVIDVLRATTTICQACAAGARSVIPCKTIEEAQSLAQTLDGPTILGGERGGLKIEGFDLGNSPWEYQPDVVKGHDVVFTTTNGTAAMRHCHLAADVLLGAFVNLNALCHYINRFQRVDILCAGTNSEVSREDVLVAGAIVSQMLNQHGLDTVRNDQADLALDAWRGAVELMIEARPLSETISASSGGRNLLHIGQADDVELCSEIDRFEIVPILDVQQWRIHSG